MARLEFIQLSYWRPIVRQGEVEWSDEGLGPKELDEASVIDRMPTIFWGNGAPWQAANWWFADRARNQIRGCKLSTLTSDAKSLYQFAVWLELKKISWLDMPIRKKDRCVFTYRKHLTELMDDGLIAPSTASERMRVVVAFYRALIKAKYIYTSAPLWEDRDVTLKLSTSTGLERTIRAQSSELSISRQTLPTVDDLEDGLSPVSLKDRETILQFARANASIEIFLMLLAGFVSGMRLGSICDLKVRTLLEATIDPRANDIMLISLGPAADPPVATKFGVNGQIRLTKTFVNRLLEYATSPRRLRRQLKAAPKASDLLFLTKKGRSYGNKVGGGSKTVDVEMCRLRKKAAALNIDAFRNFYFHRTRATYATELARIGLSKSTRIALALVKQNLLHAKEETSLRYIKFVEDAPEIDAIANSFAGQFLGLETEQLLNLERIADVFQENKHPSAHP